MIEQHFMLDTNTVSYHLRSRDTALQSRLVECGVSGVCISVITEAELRFGLLQNLSVTKLRELVDEFLSRVDSVAWNSDAAHAYAELRTHSKTRGLTLSNMDMLIAAHSIATSSTLVTNDGAFSYLSEWIQLENWVSND